MQTNQVSNPANLLSSPSPAAKQSDTGSSAPFGQVLSREIAGRNASEGARTQAPAQSQPPKQAQTQSRETGNATSARQSTRNDSKPADAKAAKEGRAQDDASASTVETATDAAVLASEEMLALVANLTQMAIPAAESAETASAAATVTDEVTIATDPALALTAIANGQTAAPLVAPVALPTQPATDIMQAAMQTKPDTSFAGITTASRNAGSKAELEPETRTRADLPQAATTNQAARTPEMIAGAPATASAGAAASRDFSAAVQESLSTVTATVTPPMQQAALQAAQSMANNVADKLTPRVGTPAWDQALGQKVVWMVAGEQQSASLTLNPPDLGPLQVVLNVSNSQATATFTAAQPEVRQALEAALPKLRDMLSEAGIQLGQASVNSGSPNQQGGFEQQASSSHGLNHTDHRSDAATADSPRVGRVIPASTGQGMIDTFA